MPCKFYTCVTYRVVVLCVCYGRRCLLQGHGSASRLPPPASSVNSPANRLVPVFAVPTSPLESAEPKSLASAHSKRLTDNLSLAESAVTKTGGILPPPFVTPLEPSPTPASSISRRINGLRTLCTNQLIKNCRISRSFMRLRTLAKTMGGGTTYST